MTLTMDHPSTVTDERYLTAPRVRIINPKLLLFIATIGFLPFLVMWCLDIASMSTPADVVTSVGRLTGLGAGYSVILLLILIARIPALEMGVGTDRLTRWHAFLGRLTTALVVMHVVTIVQGYMMRSSTSTLVPDGELVGSSASIMIAMVATAIFLLIGVVSIRAIRSRMRYEVWHAIHLAFYAAIIMTIPHALIWGRTLGDQGFAHIIWIGLNVAAFSAVIWYRVISPIRMYKRHKFRVMSVQDEGNGIVSVYITGDHLEELEVAAGQFFRWRFLTPSMKWSANPYSLSAAPRNSWLRITVKEVGDHSRALRSLPVGTKVFPEGPAGGFITHAMSKESLTGGLVLIGAGSGVAPVRSILESLPERSLPVTVIQRANQETELVLDREMDVMAQRVGGQYIRVIGQIGAPGTQMNAENFLNAVPDIQNRDIYICGPQGFMDEAISGLRKCGLAPSRIHSEQFNW